MDEVSVSTLPHPISTFFIGFLLFGGIFIYFEFKKLILQINQLRDSLNETKTNLKEMQTNYECRVTEISKKIDSRVDKAVMNLRNKN